MNIEVLRAVANATAANTVLYVGPHEGKPLAEAGLISVDPNHRDPNDANKIAARVTEAGVMKLNSLNGSHQDHKPNMSTFTIQTGGIELPKVTRGFKKGQSGGGAPSKYNFDAMNVGDFFFVANSAVSKGDAVKTLGSAAGSANQRYAVGTGEKEIVQRAKRGPDHKAVKGADGKNVMETVEVEKKNFTRKFVVRPVKAGVKYGNFEAPADGAVVARTA